MKIQLIVVLMMTLGIFACSSTKSPKAPPNSRTCLSDYDCWDWEYCGFVPGYEVAVCRQR